MGAPAATAPSAGRSRPGGAGARAWRGGKGGVPVHTAGSARQGPYAWLGRDTAAQQPAVHWEYFVQVAEYARLRTLADARGFRVGFEDELVDVTVRDGTSLLLAVEVKETTAALNQLETELRRHATGVDFDAEDRNQDGLRKAKYLLEHQPAFFALAAIGSRREFSVTLQGSNRFALDEDVVPL